MTTTTDVYARLRDLMAADQTTPTWKPACSGIGPQPWTVTRRTPGRLVPVEFDSAANGRILHYSLETAVTRSEKLNAGGAR